MVETYKAEESITPIQIAIGILFLNTVRSSIQQTKREDN